MKFVVIDNDYLPCKLSLYDGQRLIGQKNVDNHIEALYDTMMLTGENPFIILKIVKTTKKLDELFSIRKIKVLEAKSK